MCDLSFFFAVLKKVPHRKSGRSGDPPACPAAVGGEGRGGGVGVLGRGGGGVGWRIGGGYRAPGCCFKKQQEIMFLELTVLI